MWFQPRVRIMTLDGDRLVRQMEFIREVDRLKTIKGAVCRTGERAIVHSHGPHHGEEDPLRGWKGSGTIFFSW